MFQMCEVIIAKRRKSIQYEKQYPLSPFGVLSVKFSSVLKLQHFSFQF